jgi:hypothetical protein
VDPAERDRIAALARRGLRSADEAIEAASHATSKDEARAILVEAVDALEHLRHHELTVGASIRDDELARLQDAVEAKMVSWCAEGPSPAPRRVPDISARAPRRES